MLTHNLIRQPALADEYQWAIKLVYGQYIKVPEKQWKRFEDLQVKLTHEAVDIKEYAVTVAKVWRSYCAQLNLKYVPINMFLGPKSQERFWKTHGYKFVDLVSPDKVAAQVLHDEVSVAKLYIDNRGEVKLSELARWLPLSEDWWQAYEAEERPVRQAVDMLLDLYHVPHLPARNYNDIISAL